MCAIIFIYGHKQMKQMLSDRQFCVQRPEHLTGYRGYLWPSTATIHYELNMEKYLIIWLIHKHI